MEQAITLTTLQNRIGDAIAAAAAGPYWVVAEISDCKVNYSGHCYLELVERPDQGRSPIAQARAAIWSSRYKILAAYFRDQTGGDLAQGQKVLVRCSVSYHPLYGLSLTITDIDPTYTIGETERLRRATIARLQQEGIFDMNRQWPLDELPQRLAIISSPQAAGYQDFMNELSASPCRFETELFPAVMQGDGAEGAIVAAFEAVAEREEDFDAVVLIRGGGSVSDLACFDSYLICSYLAQMPLPVITGIGHDKDVSVADMVAHTSLKTPTAVAAYLTGEAEAIAMRLAQLEGGLNNGCRNLLMAADRRIEQLSAALSGRSRQRLNVGLSAMDSYSQRLHSTLGSAFERQRSRLDLFEVSVTAASPARILARGYAIVRSGGTGGAITSAKAAAVGDQICLQLKDGSIHATITQK